MLSEFLLSSKTYYFCTITYCCVVHTWGGVGWGAAITSNCTCTHTSCYASARSSQCCVVHRWGGVGWVGAIMSNCTCTHMSCYASARSSQCCTLHTHMSWYASGMFVSMLHCSHMRLGGVRWVGYTHTSIATAHACHADASEGCSHCGTHTQVLYCDVSNGDGIPNVTCWKQHSRYIKQPSWLWRHEARKRENMCWCMWLQKLNPWRPLF